MPENSIVYEILDEKIPELYDYGGRAHGKSF